MKKDNEETQFSLSHLRDLGEEKEVIRREDEVFEHLVTFLRGQGHTRENLLST